MRTSFVFACLGAEIAVVFLAALDQTIVAVALPTIVKDIGGAAAYSWIGSAYLLSMSPLDPVMNKYS